MLGQIRDLVVKRPFYWGFCNKFLGNIYLDAPSIESLFISSKDLENIIYKCVYLKALRSSMGPPINFDNSHFNLENVENFMINFCENGEVDVENAKNVAFYFKNNWKKDSKTSSFDDSWRFWQIAFVHKSKSPKKANIPEQMLVCLQVDCPSFDTLNGIQSWW